MQSVGTGTATGAEHAALPDVGPRPVDQEPPAECLKLETYVHQGAEEVLGRRRRTPHGPSACTRYGVRLRSASHQDTLHQTRSSPRPARASSRRPIIVAVTAPILPTGTPHTPGRPLGPHLAAAGPARPDPLQTCETCDRAFRSPEPGHCRGCRPGLQEDPLPGIEITKQGEDVTIGEWTISTADLPRYA
ncbi:hypothetical protein [Streptomyces sp. NBC_00212]|uniref:hypothetical protein n=1 Tax=Streptomyces sp. NBC_00212 TaxID=2975684 RepID=UPI00324A2EB0